MQVENGDKQPRDWVGYGQDPSEERKIVQNPSEGHKIVQNGHQKSRDWDRHGQNPARHKLWLKFDQCLQKCIFFIKYINCILSLHVVMVYHLVVDRNTNIVHILDFDILQYDRREEMKINCRL